MLRACMIGCIVLVCAGGTAAQERPEPYEPETPAKIESERPAATSHVKRAAFASAIVEREPVDSIDSLTTDTDKIFFFTEIVDMDGRTVKHRWTFGGEVMAEVSFAIGGPRWRIYSSKQLAPDWTGDWTVAVVDESGNPLHEGRFVYLAAGD